MYKSDEKTNEKRKPFLAALKKDIARIEKAFEPFESLGYTTSSGLSCCANGYTIAIHNCDDVIFDTPKGGFCIHVWFEDDIEPELHIDGVQSEEFSQERYKAGDYSKKYQCEIGGGLFDVNCFDNIDDALSWFKTEWVKFYMALSVTAKDDKCVSKNSKNKVVWNTNEIDWNKKTVTISRVDNKYSPKVLDFDAFIRNWLKIPTAKLFDTNIIFDEIEAYDSDKETIKINISFQDKQAGIIIGTGHCMSPIEFDLRSNESLFLIMQDLRSLLNKEDLKTPSTIETKHETPGIVFYIDDKKAGTLAKDNFIVEDEYSLANLLCELTGELNWQKEHYEK